MATEETKVVLYGYNRFKKILKQADPDLRKKMDKEIRSFLTPVSSLAKAKAGQVGTPLSGWTPETEGNGKWADRAWDTNVVQRGIAVRQGGKRSRGSATSAAWRITNKSAPGAIYELAGRKSHGKTVAGRTFVSMLRERGGEPSRLIWAAWDEKGGEKAISRDVAETVMKYENELQRLLG
jgi:hypothetical protein